MFQCNLLCLATDPSDSSNEHGEPCAWHECSSPCSSEDSILWGQLQRPARLWRLWRISSRPSEYWTEFDFKSVLETLTSNSYLFIAAKLYIEAILRCYWFFYYDSKRSIGFLSVFLRLEEEYWFSLGFFYRK